MSSITSKLHLSMTAEGHIVEVMLSGGNVADVSVADKLHEDVFGCYIAEDKGHDSDSHRNYLRSQNNIPVIPGRKNRKKKIKYDKRLVMRYDKSDSSFLAFAALAAIKIFLKFIPLTTASNSLEAFLNK